MTFSESLKDTLKSMKARRLRAFLTMLGMIIGIAAVIIIMSVGKGAEGLILGQIESVGSNLVAVLPGASDDEGPPAAIFGITVTTLKYEDALAIENQKESLVLDAVASYVRGTTKVQWRNRDLGADFTGTTASYIKVEGAEVERGKFFDVMEEQSLSRVVVLGSQIAKDLFGSEDPLDKNIKIKREVFKVIGVMAERGGSFLVNQDNQILIPLRSAQKLLLGIDHLNFIRAKVSDPDSIAAASGGIRELLRERHNIENPNEDDFSVRTLDQATDVITQVTGALQAFLIAIAAISLLVGGIGIMNIMLVVVQERINEVGLRKALGATKKNILTQFLVETVIISLFGGALGVLAGSLISGLAAWGINTVGLDWKFVISPFSIGVAVSFSLIVGIVFGIYPAWKAAKLDPIVALRYE